MDLELSPRSSPRDRRKGNSRGNRSRRGSLNVSRSPKRKSRSPKRKEKRGSASPRRRSKDRKSSRSPSSKKDRKRKDSTSGSPRRRRRSRSKRGRRRSGRKRHSRRSKRDRRRRRNVDTSTSGSPVRRSRRRKGYSSSSSTSSSSETEYHRRRRRKRGKKKRRRHVVYRVGDEVEFKKAGGRRRRSRWVSAKVDDIHRGGMYGELTYTLYLLDSGKVVDFVSKDELRFRYPRDREERGARDDELALWREDMRQINLKFARQLREREASARGRIIERAPRGRSLNATRVMQRARSAVRNVNIRPDRHQERAQSVPPGSRTWPQFLAEFANAFRDPKENHDFSGDNEDIDAYEDTGNMYPIRRGFDVDEQLLEQKRDVERTSPPPPIYRNDHRGTFLNDGKDGFKVRGREMHVNIFLPGCRGQQGVNT